MAIAILPLSLFKESHRHLSPLSVTVLLGLAGLDCATTNSRGKVQDDGGWKKEGGGSYSTEGEEIPRKSKSSTGTCIPRSHHLLGFGFGGL